MYNIVIALCGRARTGKNVAAQLISNLFRLESSPLTTQEFAFADKLKDIATELFAWDGDKTTYKDAKVLKGRNLLFNISVVLKSLKDSIFTDYVTKQIKELSDVNLKCKKGKVYLITDCRFLNEIKELKKMETDQAIDKLLLIHMKREGVQKFSTETETQMDNYKNFNYEIQNNGYDYMDLEAELKSILKREGLL